MMLYAPLFCEPIVLLSFVMNTIMVTWYAMTPTIGKCYGHIMELLVVFILNIWVIWNYVVVMFNYIDLLINFYMYDIYEVRKHQTPATHLYVCLTFGMAPNQTPTTLFCHA